MSKTISIASCKGGVGKSTSTINLGTALSVLGEKVLVVDNDPQSNLTTYLGLKSNIIHPIPTLIKAIMDNIADNKLKDMVKESIIKTPHLDVIPSHISMADLEIGIAMMTKKAYVLKRILDCIKDQYDYILIDTLPSLGIFAVNSLTASDSVIIPVETQIGGLEGFDQIIATINMVKRHFNEDLQIEGVIMTRYLTRTNLCKSIHKYLQEECDGKIKLFEPPIPQTVKIGESQDNCISIIEHAKSHVATQAYESIAREVLKASDESFTNY